MDERLIIPYLVRVCCLDLQVLLIDFQFNQVFLFSYFFDFREILIKFQMFAIQNCKLIEHGPEY